VLVDEEGKPAPWGQRERDLLAGAPS
jgi:hypothetical protein